MDQYLDPMNAFNTTKRSNSFSVGTCDRLKMYPKHTIRTVDDDHLSLAYKRGAFMPKQVVAIGP